MKQLLFVFLACCSILQVLGQKKFYPIQVGDRYGFIDEKGKTVVPAQYRNIGDFSEGLAPVRIEGTYGYINEKGKMIIAPQYDFASEFSSGLAKVYLQGKSYFIDRSGKIVFEHNFMGIDDFEENNCARVITQTGKYGVIDRSGKLLVDTVFNQMSSYNDGVFVVEGLNHHPHDYDSLPIVYEVGVIDGSGNWLIPYGKYKEIEQYQNGYAQVELIVERQKGYYDHAGYVDTKGNYLFTIPSVVWRNDYYNKEFNDGWLMAHVYLQDPNSVKKWSSSDKHDFPGFVDLNGKVVASYPQWEETTPFDHDRAFARDSNRKWYLIDRSGEKVVEQAFTDILYSAYGRQYPTLFADGVAFVEMVNGWGSIDTSGKYVFGPVYFEEFDVEDAGRKGNTLLFRSEIEEDGKNSRNLYGFWDLEYNVLVPPKFKSIDREGFYNSLIGVVEDGIPGYIDHSGKYVWKGEAKSEKPHRLNIDYMLFGNYCAHSEYKEELAGYGGWATSKNAAKSLDQSMNVLPDSLQLVIDTKHVITKNNMEGFAMYVVNTAKDTMYFSAQDSRLYLNIQALDVDGEWKDIESLTSSWCGNSYHQVFLQPNAYWEFFTPVYAGAMKTKFRAVLRHQGNNKEGEGQVLYSNEFEGEINPAQFWNTQQYVPSGLMDPRY